MTDGLAAHGFGVAFGDHVVLAQVDFALPVRGTTVLVGPAGCGKSTLVRTISGLNDCHPSLATWGKITYGGAPLTPLTRPTLVTQHARFFLDTVRENLVSALPNRGQLEQPEQTRIVTARLEAAGVGELRDRLGCNAVALPLALQRRLAIARALMRKPHVLIADEPTVGLDEGDAAEMIALLRSLARDRAVVLVTHHQRFASMAGGTTILLAGGRIHEQAPTGEFFARPRTDTGRHFVRTGGCVTPVFGVATGAKPQPRAEARSRFVGPRGFFWVLPGQLGGMPRPGIIDDLAHDLDGMCRLGITTLVTLEEAATVPVDALARAGIRSIHFPIVDMGVPDVDDSIALCRQLAGAIERGDVIAVHCRAGLGRTGTLLACQLIVAGQTPRDALDAVRSINPHCVQSTAQVDFLRVFADRHQNRTGDNTWH